MIGPHDLWLAASCIAHGLSVATVNVREFDRVRGLTVERWFTE
jgi:predicted nucleic acid-binding protein